MSVGVHPARTRVYTTGEMIIGCHQNKWTNQGAAVNRRPAGQSEGSDNLAAILAADRAFPAAVAGR